MGYPKGFRVLAADGRWMCSNGHNKSVVGVKDVNQQCLLCARESQWRRYRARAEAKGKMFVGDRREIAKLKAMRLAHGLTQQELAELAGVSRPTVQGIESGRRKACRAVAEKLVAAFAGLIRERKRKGLAPVRVE